MKKAVVRNKGKSLLKKIDDYTVIDIETTGRSIYESEIIELSAVRVRNNIIVDEYSTLVSPTELIPLNITMLTGITNEMVINKPAIDEVIQDYIDFLGDDILLGHNINSFDVNILYDTYKRYCNKLLTNDLIDTLRFAMYCNLDTENLKLQTIANYFGITNEKQHRSLYDCRTNHLVYLKLKDIFSINEKRQKRLSNKKSSKHSSNETIAIKELQDALQHIIDTNSLDVENLCVISDWLDEHFDYIEKYPFNEIEKSINAVLEDGIVDEYEKDSLIELFKTSIDPLSHLEEDKSECVDIYNKKICITGDFSKGSRAEVIHFLENNGAQVTTAVSGKTDILIVGELGSSNWQCGNYGSKIKKALELQQNGHSIKIFGEKEFFEKELHHDDICEKILNMINDIETKHNIVSKNTNALRLELKELKDNRYSIALGSIISCRINILSKCYRLTIRQSLLKSIILSSDAEIKPCEDESNFVDIDFHLMHNDFYKLIEMSLEDTILNYKPKNRFGCCSKYLQCSDAKKCLHDDLIYAKGCWYRDNLENGKFFYGKNKNI